MKTNELIRDFIVNDMLHARLSSQLTDEDQLIESGIIDSLGIMSLLSFLEEKFSIQIPSEDLSPENFESISTITALVNRHLTH